MKSGFGAGAIAGIFGGLVAFLFANISIVVGIFPVITGGMIYVLTNHMALNVIWGAIFGLVYAKFYDAIPGKSLVKGYIYGVIYWMATNAYPMSISQSYGIMAGGWTDIGFILISYFANTSYGLVLGVLYKPK
jgi:hypothetical protein